MDLKSEISGKALIIEVNAENIDIGNSIEFREALAAEAEKQSDIVVLDLKKVNYIDSSGLGVLITFLRFIKDGGRSLRLANCNDKVSETMKSTRLENEIPVFANLDEALK